MIQHRKLPLAETDNVGVVYDRLMMMGADMVIETVDAILRDDVRPIPQEELCDSGMEATPAPKIFTETCHIDWNRDSRSIYNQIRGLSPYPAAWTEIADVAGKLHHAKIYATALPSDDALARIISTDGAVKPGVMTTDGRRLKIACGDNRWIEITSIQIAGKRRMTTEEFLRGFRL